jgi:hypothetical protein
MNYKELCNQCTLDAQKIRCDECIWKSLEHHGGWCYMFRDFMPNCMKFESRMEKTES